MLPALLLLTPRSPDRERISAAHANMAIVAKLNRTLPMAVGHLDSAIALAVSSKDVFMEGASRGIRPPLLVPALSGRYARCLLTAVRPRGYGDEDNLVLPYSNGLLTNSNHNHFAPTHTALAIGMLLGRPCHRHAARPPLPSTSAPCRHVLLGSHATCLRSVLPG